MTASEYKALLLETSRAGGFPSVDRDGECRYLAPDGRRCAAGLLIPPERYQENFEGIAAGRLFEMCLPDLIPAGLTVEDLLKVQAGHDAQSDKPVWNHARFKSWLNTIDNLRDA